MAIFYTADTHFGHENIMKYCKRPFSSVHEMDQHMLGKLQEIVKPEDDVYIVGDFAFAKSHEASHFEALLSSIPGRKHLLCGNHDKHWMTKVSGWSSVNEMKEILDEGTRVTLCHYPMITFPGARHGGLQLFGHVHNNWHGSRNSVNVGVDVWDFWPVRLADIKRRAEKLSINPLWDTVEPPS